MFIARGVLYFYVCMAIGCTTVKEKGNKRDFVLSWFEMEETLCWVMQSSVSGEDKQVAVSSG
jgi:hypothetical protein